MRLAHHSLFRLPQAMIARLRRLKSKLRLEATVGAALIAGAFTVVGIGATYYSHEQSAAASNRKAAQAAETVMYVGFDQAAWELCRVGRNGYFLGQTPALRPEATHDDRLRVAGTLPARDWLTVAAA